MKVLIPILIGLLVVGCGEKEEPLIADPFVEEAIRESIFKPTGKLTKQDLEKVMHVFWKGKSVPVLVHDDGLKEIAKLPNLRLVILEHSQVTDVGLSELTKLTQLNFLGLNGTQITDLGLKEVAKIGQLTSVSLKDTKVTHKGVLNLQKALPRCIVHHNAILGSDGSAKLIEVAIRKQINKPIGKLTTTDLNKVKELNLRKVLINDISSLAGLEQLENLDLAENKIRDISVLKELKQLKTLNLHGNQITEIGVLKELRHLTKLYCGKNQIRDISPLEELVQLKELVLFSNQISDLSALNGLKHLVTLQLGKNQINNVSALGELKQLKKLGLHENQIKDLKALEELNELEELNLRNLFPKNKTSAINDNPDLSKAQIAELKKALPNCKIYSDPLISLPPPNRHR